MKNKDYQRLLTIKLILFSAFISAFSSCSKSDREDSGTAGSSHETNLKRTSSIHNREARDLVPNEGTADSISNSLTSAESFQDSTDAEIDASLKDFLSSSNLSLNSENTANFVDGLKQLLTRKSPYFYEILGLLPPGYFSEKLVSQVFLEAHMDLDDFLLVTTKIKEPDLLKAAVNGGVSSMLVSEGKKGTIGIEQLEQLKSIGLSEQNFSAVLVDGFKAGRFSLNDVARNISDANNFTINSMGRIISRDQLMKLTLLTYENGRKIDNSSLKVMGHGLAQSDGASAINWAQKLPENEGILVAHSIFSEWMDADPLAASKFLGQMNHGKVRDISILELIKNCIRNKGLEDAKSWASQIEDKGIKDNAIKIIRDASPPAQQ